MKYQITINQAGVVAANLHGKTDLTDWAILSHIYGWQANSRAERSGGKVWINYRNLINELPLLGLSSKGAVTNRITKLRGLNLIETEHTAGGRMFAKTTPLYETIAEYREPPHGTVHKNEQPDQGAQETVQSDEHSVHESERGVHGGEQGPVHSGELYPITNSYPSTSPLPPEGGETIFTPDEIKSAMEALEAQTAERKKQTAEKIEKARARDILWEALMAGCGITATPTKSERGKWNKALRELKEAGATAEEIADRCKRWSKQFPGAKLTPNGLANNWSVLVARDGAAQKIKGLGGQNLW